MKRVKFYIIEDNKLNSFTEEEKKDANESDISHYAPDKMVAKLKHDYDVFVTKLDETKSTNPDAQQTQQI